MANDRQLEIEASRLLKAERRIGDSSRLAVKVAEGVAVLTGSVTNCADEVAAVAAIEQVPGIKGVVRQTIIEAPAPGQPEDIQLLRSVMAAIDRDSSMPPNGVKLSIFRGWVVLDGTLHDEYQRTETEERARKTPGIRGISNNIVVVPAVKSSDVTLSIERAFRGAATRHAQDIHIEVEGAKVVLSGVVHALVEIAEAGQAAYQVPGVVEVENRLELTPLLERRKSPPGGA